jgi:hypothetical protein
MFQPKECPTMRDVSNVLESLREDLVENGVSSRRLRQSIFSMLVNSKCNTIGNSAMA